LEEKLEAIQTRIAQLEGAISIFGQQRQRTAPTRRQAFTYHPPQLELQPFTEENLAKRLAASALTIRNHRETKIPKEFESRCRQREERWLGVAILKGWALSSGKMRSPQHLIYGIYG
jgi:hypothetical protein